MALVHVYAMPNAVALTKGLFCLYYDYNYKGICDRYQCLCEHFMVCPLTLPKIFTLGIKHLQTSLNFSLPFVFIPALLKKVRVY